MDIIAAVLDGSMGMEEFLHILEDDPSLGDAIRKLLPEEAIGVPEHPFWERRSYGERMPHDVLRDYDFDYMRLVERALHGPSREEIMEVTMKGHLRMMEEYPELRGLVPDDAIGVPEHPFWESQMPKPRRSSSYSVGDYLNVFGVLEYAYSYWHPDFNFTDKYQQDYSLYLDAFGDYFEGPEVEHIVKKIVEEVYDVKPNSKRLSEAKRKIKIMFHVEGNRRPRWIQGPEWPYGKHSPMKYISRKEIPDGMAYLFEDVDTGEQRTVEQYY